MNNNKQILQPAGWAQPRGYANGVAASGRQVFVAGQIGWNERCEFDSDDFIAQVRQTLLNIRAVLAGPYRGLGLGCLIFAQPFLWVVLGAAWGFALFGRFISMMSDNVGRGGGTIYNWLAGIVEFLLAAGPLLYAFGFIG